MCAKFCIRPANNNPQAWRDDCEAVSVKLAWPREHGARKHAESISHFAYSTKLRATTGNPPRQCQQGPHENNISRVLTHSYYASLLPPSTIQTTCILCAFKRTHLISLQKHRTAHIVAWRQHERNAHIYISPNIYIYTYIRIFLRPCICQRRADRPSGQIRRRQGNATRMVERDVKWWVRFSRTEACVHTTEAHKHIVYWCSVYSRLDCIRAIAHRPFRPF